MIFFFFFCFHLFLFLRFPWAIFRLLFFFFFFLILFTNRSGLITLNWIYSLKHVKMCCALSISGSNEMNIHHKTKPKVIITITISPFQFKYIFRVQMEHTTKNEIMGNTCFTFFFSILNGFFFAWQI